MYNTNINTPVYTYSENCTADFLQTHSGLKFYNEASSYILQEESFFNVIDKCINYIEKLSIGKSTNIPVTKTFSLENNVCIIESEKVSDLVNPIPILIVLRVRNTNNFRAMHSSRRSIDITVYSSKGIVTELFDWFDSMYAGAKIAQIHWWYKYNGSSTYTSIPLAEPFKVQDVCYPFLKRPPYDYFKEYLDSTCPLVFLSGPPGTGKTSFLRAMIWEFGLTASVTYDADVLLRDEMFINFLTGSPDVLIFEDSEEFVTSRENDKNSFMTRFLNISDGLIKTKNKKVIFTTNFRDFSDIDEALTRPGRCYDFVDFRKLSYGESIKVCQTLKLEVPSEIKHYSLAELYNQEHSPNVPEKKIGF